MWVLLALALTFPDASAFKSLSSTEQIDISIARSGEVPWVLATHTLSVAPEKVFELLSNFGNYQKVFAGSVKSVAILSTSKEATRLHVVWPLPFPMRNRDAVIKYSGSKTATGYLIDWLHDDAKGDPSEGLRIEKVAGKTEITTGKTPGTTLVTYTYFADLGGSLPEFIKEASYIEEPIVYFNSIRKYFGLTAISGK